MSRRLILGNSTRGIGLYIAKPGFDAAAATDDQLIFSSDWPAMLPIHATGIINGAANTNTFAYFPQQGYVPFAMFFYRGARPGWYSYRGATYIGNSGDDVLRIDLYSDHVILGCGPVAHTAAYVIFKTPTGF